MTASDLGKRQIHNSSASTDRQKHDLKECSKSAVARIGVSGSASHDVRAVCASAQTVGKDLFLLAHAAEPVDPGSSSRLAAR